MFLKDLQKYRFLIWTWSHIIRKEYFLDDIVGLCVYFVYTLFCTFQMGGVVISWVQSIYGSTQGAWPCL